MRLSGMPTVSYQARRGEIETYFDRTAADAWKKLTSTAPVGRIRATVRAGRNEMRATLLGWLPQDLTGLRILDAGCGTGALAVEAAGRGADVVALDLSPTLVALAEERAQKESYSGSIRFEVGDMMAEDLGKFDHVVAMDSLIHYRAADAARVLAHLAERTTQSIQFTVAPRTPALTIMHAVGRLFPRGDRAPAIEPVAATTLQRVFANEAGLAGWRVGRTHRVGTGFYISQAMELLAP